MLLPVESQLARAGRDFGMGPSSFGMELDHLLVDSGHLLPQGLTPP
jgi:hypothetical protein